MFKVDPRAERNNNYLKCPLTHDIGLQMKQKELTKTFMMISNWEKTFGLHGLYNKYFSVVVDDIACQVVTCCHVMFKVEFWRSHLSVVNAYNSEIFYINHYGNERVIFSFFLSPLMCELALSLHLNTYVMGLRQLYNFFQCGDRFQTSKSDVYRSQILPSNVGLRAERVDGKSMLGFVLLYETGWK